MKYRLSDLIDTATLESLLDGFSAMAGVTATLIGIADGVCISPARQELCQKFHQASKETSKFCDEAFSLFKNPPSGENCFKFKCGNGLENVFFPIKFRGEHVATLAVEQFFYDRERPDEKEYSERAEKYGFKKKEYLEAFRKVPSFTREKIDSIMGFYAKLAGAILEAGERRADQLEFGRKYIGLLENLQAGIIIVNEDMRIFMADQAIADSLGYSVEELQGFDLLRLMPRKTMKRFMRATESAAGGAKKNIDVDLVKKDGGLASGIFRLISLPASPESAAGFIIGFTDLTEHMALEEDLKKAKAAAEIADRAKSSFLAAMSHEIRTPLSSIIGFSNLLSCAPLDEGQAGLVKCITTSGRHLLNIINDVLDISKIESGAFELEENEFDVEAAVAEVADIVKIQYRNKKVDFNYSFDSAPECNVVGDRVRLKQILINLSANASRFTASGEVRIAVDTVGNTGEHLGLKFSVTDTGSGISETDADGIFRPFIQGGDGGGSAAGGTGLGLSISNHLVRLMGGEGILLESAVGTGSKFYFTLKFKKGSNIRKTSSDGPFQEKAPATCGLPALEVLVVEDNALNMQLMRMYLEKSGHRVCEAGNGKTAFEILRSRKFDIIFMDIQLPMMGGIETTRRIREAGIAAPVIALTANAVKSDLESYIRSGMDAFLTKPFEFAELDEIIRKHGYSRHFAPGLIDK